MKSTELANHLYPIWIPPAWQDGCARRLKLLPEELRRNWFEHNRVVFRICERAFASVTRPDQEDSLIQRLQVNASSSFDNGCQFTNPDWQAHVAAIAQQAIEQRMDPVRSFLSASMHLAAPIEQEHDWRAALGTSLLCLCKSLNAWGFNRAVVEVCELIFEVADDSLDSFAAITAQLPGARGFVGWDEWIIANFVSLWGNSLGHLSEHGIAASRRLHEAYLEVRETDYGDFFRLDAALSASSRLIKLDANNATILITTLAENLHHAQSIPGPEYSLKLINAYLGVDLIEDDWSRLAGSRRWQETHPDNQGSLLHVWCRSLMRVAPHYAEKVLTFVAEFLNAGHPADPLFQQTLHAIGMRTDGNIDDVTFELLYLTAEALLLQAFQRKSADLARSAERVLLAIVGLEPSDEVASESNLCNLLARRLESSPFNQHRKYAYLQKLALCTSVRSDQLAMQIVEAAFWPNRITEFAVHSDGADWHNVISLIVTWLWLAQVDDEPALSVCQSALEFVIHLRDDVMPTLHLRHELVQTCYRMWAEIERLILGRVDFETEAELADSERIESLYKKLHEWYEQFNNRMIVERLLLEPHRQPSQAASNLIDWQPFGEPIQPPIRDALAEMDDERATGSLSPPSFGVFNHCLTERFSTDPRSCLPSTFSEDPSSLRRRLFEPGASRTDIEDLVPPDVVWLRMMSGFDGRIRWFAWRKNDCQLRLLAHGASDEFAVQKLETANWRFDLEVERVWNANSGVTLPDSLRRQLKEMTARLRSLVESGSELTARHNDWIEALESLRQWSPMLTRLGQSILVTMYKSQPVPDWYLEDWQAGLGSLRNPWGDVTSSDREKRRRDELDQATLHHLAALQAVVDLSPLAGCDLNWNEIDLIFQGDGALMVTPWQLLSFSQGGKPVWDCVASTSTVISMTLRQKGADASHPPTRSLLSMAWDRPESPIRTDMRQLQLRLQEIGLSHLWNVWCLGDDPSSTLANLAAVCSSRENPFGIIVVNAHGTADTWGVQLAQGEQWQGDLVSLENCDLLIFASCSVGRLRKNGADVQGLVSSLASNRARSIIAARWPIASNETTQYVSAITEQLLSEYDAEQLATSYRARSMNIARRRLLADGTISLHLAAAFDFFGLA